MELSPLQMDPVPSPTCFRLEGGWVRDWRIKVALSRLSSAFAHREPYQRSRRNEPDMLGRAMRTLTSRDKNSHSMEQPIAGDELRANKRYLATRADKLLAVRFRAWSTINSGIATRSTPRTTPAWLGTASRASGGRSRRRRPRPRFARIAGVAPPRGRWSLRQCLIEAKTRHSAGGRKGPLDEAPIGVKCTRCRGYAERYCHMDGEAPCGCGSQTPRRKRAAPSSDERMGHHVSRERFCGHQIRGVRN